MQKSKRFGGPVPELNPNASQSGSDTGSTGGDGSSTSVDRGGENDKDGPSADDSTTSGKDKGKERAHS